MRLAACLGAVLATVSCSTARPSADVASPSADPAGPFAVMVHTAGGDEPYFVTLVPLSGLGGAWVQPTTRSLKTYYPPPTPCPPPSRCPSSETANYQFPEVSISNTRVYFLDGDTEIKSLAPDGTVQLVMTVPASPTSQVVFAVSPDDKRIAIAVIALATTNIASSFNEQMYVEDVGTAANRVDIYSSTTWAEWPVGWHSGKVVVAGADNVGVYVDSRYGGTGYRILDPTTGRMLAELDCARGLLVQAGTACATGFCLIPTVCYDGSIGKQGWDGHKTAFALPAGPAPRIFPSYLDLSPDGKRIAAGVVKDPQTGVSETDVFGDGTQSPVTSLGPPLGWIDSSHLVVVSLQSVWIVDADHGTSKPMDALKKIAQQGEPSLAGVLPANL